MKRCGRRALSILLALTIVGSILPATVWAAEPAERYGTLGYFSSAAGEYVADSYYYSDQWFSASPSDRNDSLALISAQLASAATDEFHGTALLRGLGFADAAVCRYGSGEPDDCAYTIGTKQIRRDGLPCTLVAVTFQGADYGQKGWLQNVTVNGPGGDGDDHASYEAAARRFLEDLSDRKLDGSAVFWLTGQSRGGAIANLAAAYLLDRQPRSAVFAYTFESPAVSSKGTAAHGERYQGIHNYLCSDDPVSMLPLWGMTRYGQTHSFPEVAVSSMEPVLTGLSPAAGQLARSYDDKPFDGDVGVYFRRLADKLETVVPTRAAYTERNVDAFLENGVTTRVEYTYQDGLRALCCAAFSDETEDLASRLTLLLEDETALPNLTYSRLEEAYVQAKQPENGAELLADAAQKRWKAAGILWERLMGDGQTEYTQADGYAVLKLLSALLIDTSQVTGQEGKLPPFDESFDVVQYLDLRGLMDFTQGTKTLFFSHYSDTILARLKLLAPAPAMEDVALRIPAPKAGDDTEMAPAALRNGIKTLGKDWLTVEDAAWLTDESTLGDNQVFYLRLTLAAVGHTLSEDTSLTVNGRAPVSRRVSYQDGQELITGVWAYCLGTPKKIAVNFEANGYGTAPASASVDQGTLLRYALMPDDPEVVRDSQGTWRFDGWYDQTGSLWDTVTAVRDVTLYGKWTRLIDEVALTFPLPHEGDSSLALSVPENGGYRVSKLKLWDENWDSVTKIKSLDALRLEIQITPDTQETDYLLREDETGGKTFAGSFTVNGTPCDMILLREDGVLSATFPFFPLPAENAVSVTQTQVAPADSSCGKDLSCPICGFPDAQPDAWYHDGVHWALEEGVMNGVSEGRFAPDTPTTRAMAVTMLWRLTGEKSGSASRFSDVESGAWYEQAVNWAAEAGIIKGTAEAVFSPDDPVTREQLAAILYRFAQNRGKGFDGTWACLLTFPDAGQVSSYAYEPLCWLNMHRVIQGMDNGALAPTANASRAQIAAMLLRFWTDMEGQ